MQYRKKPIVIEAVQFLGDYVEGICHCSDSEKTHCHTLEGVLNVSHGDFIIKGVNGEIYPCKPDIFAKTYEPVGDPA